jgi:hypothetical protein
MGCFVVVMEHCGNIYTVSHVSECQQNFDLVLVRDAETPQQVLRECNDSINRATGMSILRYKSKRTFGP